MTNKSLKSRYTAKLTANVVGLAIGLISTAIIPRGLGPKAYGDFNFLTNFFTQLLPLFTLSTHYGFYIKLSQRQTEFPLINFYSKFTALAILILFGFIVFAQLSDLDKVFWIDQAMPFVIMAAIYSSIIWIIQILTNIADASGNTVSTEIAKVFQKLFGLLIIGGLFLMHKLDMISFFIYNYSVSILLIVALIYILKQKGPAWIVKWKLSKTQIKDYVKEFYEYSKPLFVFAVAGVITGIFDRWLLQKFAGSIQQGYFGLSYQIGAACLVFTSAMSILIMREFAIAFKNNDIGEMARLFRRYIPLLYAIAAFLGCFACINASKIAYLFGGKQYADAVLPLAIMSLYPIHQTYGQLSGSVFYATGQTKLYRNIGLAQMLLGLPVVYFALAPIENLGFNAGATGLALKFVIVNFIIVNVQLYFNAKLLKLSFLKYFGHQLICVGSLIGLALFSSFFIDRIPLDHDNVLFTFLLSGIVYSSLVLILLYFFPSVFGLFKDDLAYGLNKIIEVIKMNRD